MADNRNDAGERGLAGLGFWLATAASVIGFLVSLADYLWRDSGIAGTPGAILVIASTAILFALFLYLRVASRRSALRVPVLVISLIDILGTAFAGYLLDSQALLGLMVVCLVGWLLVLFAPRSAPVPA